MTLVYIGSLAEWKIGLLIFKTLYNAQCGFI